MQKRNINLKNIKIKEQKLIKKKIKKQINNITEQFEEINAIEREAPEYFEIKEEILTDMKKEKMSAAINLAKLTQLKEYNLAKYIQNNPKIVKAKIKELDTNINKIIAELKKIKNKKSTKAQQLENKLKSEYYKLNTKKNTLSMFLEINEKNKKVKKN